MTYIFNKYEKTKEFSTLKNIINDYIYKKIGFRIIDKIFFSCVKKCSKYGGAGVNLLIKLNEYDEQGYIELYIYEILNSMKNDFLSLLYFNKILYNICPYVNIRLKDCVCKDTYIFGIFCANYSL